MNLDSENTVLNRGKIIRQREVSGHILTEAIYPSESRLLKHWHKKANFCLALSGSGTEHDGNCIRDFSPLTVSFLPADHVHSLTFYADPMRCFTVDVSPHCLERMREYSIVCDVSSHFRPSLVTDLFFRLYREFDDMDNAATLAIEGLLLEMLAAASRHQISEESSSPRWLKRARDLLHTQFSEPVRLTELAAQVSVHPVHLAREFRKHYGFSVGEYLRRIRIDYACRRLLESDDPTAIIASAAGFSDQSHFSRIFKRLRGMTPRQFRFALRVNKALPSSEESTM